MMDSIVGMESERPKDLPTKVSHLSDVIDCTLASHCESVKANNLSPVKKITVQTTQLCRSNRTSESQFSAEMMAVALGQPQKV